jgi:hypothetical protein
VVVTWGTAVEEYCEMTDSGEEADTAAPSKYRWRPGSRDQYYTDDGSKLQVVRERSRWSSYVDTRHVGSFREFNAAMAHAENCHGGTDRGQETMASAATESAPRKRAAKPDTSKAPKTPKAKTVAGFPATAMIRMQKDSEGNVYGDSNNPKRKGSAAAKKFSKYRDGMTLAEYVKAGGTANGVKYDIEHGYIKVG